jgi:hypothetical protein
MPKNLDYDKFLKWLKEKGYKVRQTAKHHEVVTKDEKDWIARFAVDHHKGRKPEVYGHYIKRIEEAIEKYEGQ